MIRSNESGMNIKVTPREQADAYFINQIKDGASNKINLGAGSELKKTVPKGPSTRL